MRLSTALTLFFTGLAASQSLTIPTRKGSIISLSSPSTIAVNGNKNYDYQEYDRGRDCNTDDDTGDANAVFILENGATLANVIIGARQLEGVHCKGACTLRNVYFRDVCEDAISALGTGDVLIEGGGAQSASDKVVQHNGRGTVTIRGGTYVNIGKLYRSCGDCTSNGGPRNVVVDGVKVNGVTSDLVGINVNYGDKATISGSCGVSKKVCQQYQGVQKDSGSSTKDSGSANCGGAQGKLSSLPSC